MDIHKIKHIKFDEIQFKVHDLHEEPPDTCPDCGGDFHVNIGIMQPSLTAIAPDVNIVIVECKLCGKMWAWRFESFFVELDANGFSVHL